MTGWSSDGAVVTPEAVRLDFDVATLGPRTLSALIDLAVIFGLQVATLLLVGLAAASGQFAVPEAAGVVILVVLVFLVLWGYPTALETLWRGKSLGKAALGLRVITVEGAPIRFRHAAIRAVLTLVDFYATSGAGAVLAVLFSPRHQRLGDMVAGTIVVRERTGAPAPRPVWFTVPPGWEGYAATLDTAGLTARDQVALRSFLLRLRELRPDARAALAAELARSLAGRIGHPLPPTVPAEVFLACLAARIQARVVGGAQPVQPGAAKPSPPAGGLTPPPRGAGFAPPT